MAAISTYQVFLMRDGEKLVDIKDFPDLGGAPETLETTTLSDNMTTSIPGIQSLEALTFTANYDYEEYAMIKGYEEDDRMTPAKYAVWFGATGADENGKPTPDGHNGKFEFNGKLTVHTTGGGVNEVVNMVITIAPSTPIVFS
jgi:hypothetical protein